NGFRSAQDLYASLRADGAKIGLTTVYRALQALTDAGEVDVLMTDEGEAVYRACSTPTHHHHLVCRDCGKAVEIEGPAVESWADELAAQHGFVDLTHTLELFATCSDCAAAKPRTRFRGTSPPDQRFQGRALAPHSVAGRAAPQPPVDPRHHVLARPAQLLLPGLVPGRRRFLPPRGVPVLVGRHPHHFARPQRQAAVPLRRQVQPVVAPGAAVLEDLHAPQVH